MTTLRAEKPDEINFTLTITHKLKDWRKLAEQLKRGHESQFTDWPGTSLRDEIDSMVSLAERFFYPDTSKSS